MSKKGPKELKRIIIARTSIIVLCTLIVSFEITVALRTFFILNTSEVPSISEEEYISLNNKLDSMYKDKRGVLTYLPYNTTPPILDVGAKSSIVINLENGNILYENNPDEVIPPASMTKMFVMYVVFQELKKGNVHLNDIVPLPPECWASNMMPHSSLMFLGKNQIVTLDELMTGLAVCSGNDASYAIAYYICGGMDAFLKRMNDEVRKLGLTHTYFEEPSGYSEKNITTAREMALFCKVYLEMFPEEAYKYHSTKKITYPEEHNLAPEDRGKERAQDFTNGFPEHITMGITQQNTNPLLGKLEGCNGLKTGYIDESGYNLALSVTRGNMTVVSVTLGGKGNNTYEGQQGRIHDGTELMKWSFSTFENYKYDNTIRNYSVPLLKSKKLRCNLIPAYKPSSLSIPKTIALNPNNASEELNVSVKVPLYLSGEIEAGKEYAYIIYSIGNYTLERIPLVAEKNIKKSCLWFSLADNFVRFAIR